MAQCIVTQQWNTSCHETQSITSIAGKDVLRGSAPTVTSCNNNGIVGSNGFCWVCRLVLSRGPMGQGHLIFSQMLILYLDGRNMPFVNRLKYLGATFNERNKWGRHIKMSETKVFRTYNRLHPLLKSESLRANLKLTFHRA
jgi:hypothetical protein